MAREILTVAGQVIGNSVGGPIGAAVGGMIGGAIGGAIDPPPQPNLGDRHVQITTHGASIPMLFGAVRTAGILVWAAELAEGSSGGKGGPPAQAEYVGTFAVAFARNRLNGFRKLWFNGVLVFDDTLNEDAAIPRVEYEFYDGGEDQLASPTIESYEGAGEVSPMRGTAYLVLKNIPLGNYGNRIPSVEAEIVSAQTWGVGAQQSLDDEDAVAPSDYNWHRIFVTTDRQYLLIGSDNSGGQLSYRTFDPFSGQYGAATVLAGTNENNFADAIYVEETGDIFVCEAGSLQTTVMRFTPDSAGALVDSWVCSDFDKWPTGVSGAYMVFDRSYPGINLVFASQFSTLNLQRIDLTTNALGKTSSSVTYATGFASGGRHFCIALSAFGFQQIALTPGNPNAASWEPKTLSGHAYLHIESAYASGPPDAPEFDALPESAVWERGAATSASYPRAAFDSKRGRWLILDRDGANWFLEDAAGETPSAGATLTALGAAIASHFDVLYSSGMDAFVVAIDTARAWVLGAEDLSYHISAGVLPDATGGLPAMRQSLTDPGAVIMGGRPFLNAPWRLYEQPLYSTTVGEAVQALCIDAGYVADDLDVSELTQRLRGFRVVEQGAYAGAIGQLGSVFGFDVVEESDKLVGKLRGRAAVASYTSAECIVDSPGARPVEQTRADEATLPRRLTLTVPELRMDYQPGSQLFQRQTARNGQDQSAQADVVLTADEAKRAVDRLGYAAWAERISYRAALAGSGRRLAGADVITIDGVRMRVIGKTLDGMVARLELVDDDDGTFDQRAAGALSEWRPQTPARAVAVEMALVFSPMLRPTDSSYGAYWAAWPRAGFSYRTARLLEAPADGSNPYTDKGSSIGGVGSTVGQTTQALGDWTGGRVFDHVNKVRLHPLNGEFESITPAQAVAGGNAIMVGLEMMHFTTATVVSGGGVELSGLIRGVGGTESWMGNHRAGEVVVLLTASGLGAFDTIYNQQGTAFHYTAQSVGAADVALGQTTLYTSRRLLVPPPVHLHGARDDSDDIVITWGNRSRLPMSMGGAAGIYVPPDPSGVHFKIEMLDGATVVRTVYVNDANTYTYTAAEQTTDFGAPLGATGLDIRITHTNATVPAGMAEYFTEATV
jgi:Putative phage tail protein